MEGFISQDDTEAVLKKVMDDGSFDKMRHHVIDQIKQNKDIVSKSEQLVRGSKTLSAPGAGGRTKKDLFEAIRRELEDEVLNEAVKAAWEILTTPTSEACTKLPNFQQCTTGTLPGLVVVAQLLIQRKL
ncbi:hypothetical protein WJX84_005263 [Apatococcus fuscideae]|uniref:Uncharacterized protein n=1 Tax=Apatococcus fuscideae TaxID=2026836 RepID=A0AAW1TIZ8_9CHLO